ncbi:hypothetical protein [Variovorax boronicumulans]|uniref:hypothetical protein n=1 Tax=Variovorax boronicumulans TaxID=436515 RepID=UPI0033942924
MIEKKLQALAQKRHLKNDFPEICEFPNAEYICFPESSQVLKALQVAAENKTSSESLDPALYQEAIERFFEIEKQDDYLYIVLPCHSAQIGYTYTRYPLLKLRSTKISLQIWKILQAKTEVPDFLAFCAADFSYGVVVDVFAGDPLLHRTDGPVYEIKIWP